MITTPEIVESPAQKIAFIHVNILRPEIMQAMHSGLDELSAALKAQGIKPTGPWFTHHTRRPNETFDFRICFPVEKDVKPTGRVEPGVLEATRVARTVYTGNYAGLGGAWGEFVAWTEANNLKTREDLWEHYLLGPESGTPPEEWRTEMNRPMA
jgi:effector-binding domain-containing protein